MSLKPRILIVGGYGAFGARAAERLSREPGFEIVVAGRSLAKARQAAAQLALTAVAKVEAATFDAMKPDAAVLSAIAPTVVINASGPFQAQDFGLARAAIGNGAHYIDLADAAEFVTGFARDRDLDQEARAHGVLATSGASTVPATLGGGARPFRATVRHARRDATWHIARQQF